MFEMEYYPEPIPQDSYSRELDKRAQSDTLPYGYPENYYLEPIEVEFDKGKFSKKRSK